MCSKLLLTRFDVVFFKLAKVRYPQSPNIKKDDTNFLFDLYAQAESPYG